MTIILETPRLILRHQVIEDLDDLWTSNRGDRSEWKQETSALHFIP